MRTVTLSGWGQPHDALSHLIADSQAIDYAAHGGIPEALSDIVRQARQAELVIGWSLGGQLAVRAIAGRMIRPRRLVLIAAPFQFVQDEESLLGMKRDLYDKFRENYARNPARTLNKAWELIAKDDIHEKRVRAALQEQSKEAALARNWLNWLILLDGFSCDGLDFSDFPPTLLIHGDNDMVVEADQSECFMEALPQARLMTFTGCGHAPHWHDPHAVRKAISEHMHV